ncbi:hypothetical protein FKM82_021851 [Ascaphus truei]
MDKRSSAVGGDPQRLQKHSGTEAPNGSTFLQQSVHYELPGWASSITKPTYPVLGGYYTTNTDSHPRSVIGDWVVTSILCKVILT